MRPVICMITDRRRSAAGGADALVERVAAAARAGVDLVQIRERDLDGGPLAQIVERCVSAVAGTRTRVLVNDRLDVALATGAHGVHLRGDSFPAHRVRPTTPPGFLVGRSVHSVDDAVRHTIISGTDYLICGTVFATPSKAGHRPAGVRTLADVVHATSVPVLAIGGVTIENAAEIAHAGAAGMAAIGLFWDCSLDVLQRRVAAVATAFDTPRRRS